MPKGSTTTSDVSGQNVVSLNASLTSANALDVWNPAGSSNRTSALVQNARTYTGSIQQGVLSGGNYFIAKPIDPSELALKVTIHLFKAQVQNASRQDTKPETEPQTNSATNGASQTMAPPVVQPAPVAPPPPVAPLPPVVQDWVLVLSRGV